MMRKITIVFRLSIFLFLIFSVSYYAFSAEKPSGQLKIYSAPKGALLNETFSVQVRKHGGQWRDTPVHLIKVDEVQEGKHTARNSSMAFFDFSGRVEVRVTYNDGSINSASIRPLSYEIENQIQGNSLLFLLISRQIYPWRLMVKFLIIYTCLPINGR